MCSTYQKPSIIRLLEVKLIDDAATNPWRTLSVLQLSSIHLSTYWSTTTRALFVSCVVELPLKNLF